jgi:signal transduction histidine kinase
MQAKLVQNGWRVASGSLRSQFLVPLIATLFVMGAMIAVVSWWVAESSARRSIRSRLNNVLELGRAAPFPLTENVLRQIKDISGVELVIVDSKTRSAIGTLLDVSEVAAWYRSVRASSGWPPLSREAELLSVSVGGRTYDTLLKPYPSQAARPADDHLIALIDAAERWRVTRQAFWLPALTGILSTIALAFVAVSVVNHMVQRLERLERQVERVAMGNYQTTEIDGVPEDAIDRLGASVNKMSQQLERARDEIVRAERTRMINLIASGMAHQLRNSLGGAVLLLQSVSRQNAAQPHASDPQPEITMALNQIRLAEESIRRLMTMSHSGVQVTDHPMTIVELHASLESFLGSLADHHRVGLSFLCSPADADRIIARGETTVGAILNLVMNAIEAAGDKGIVECQYDFQSDPPRDAVPGAPPAPATSGFHRWRIRDNGKGPPREIAHQILEPFITTKPEGVGLGLPTTARIAQERGGSLSWHRESTWTVFAFTLREPQSS